MSSQATRVELVAQNVLEALLAEANYEAEEREALGFAAEPGEWEPSETILVERFAIRTKCERACRRFRFRTSCRSFIEPSRSAGPIPTTTTGALDTRHRSAKRSLSHPHTRISHNPGNDAEHDHSPDRRKVEASIPLTRPVQPYTGCRIRVACTNLNPYLPIVILRVKVISSVRTCVKHRTGQVVYDGHIPCPFVEPKLSKYGPSRFELSPLPQHQYISVISPRANHTLSWHRRGGI
ncbi:hypothetical protein GCM10027414_24270 [Humibacter ginsengiterrae]